MGYGMWCFYALLYYLLIIYICVSCIEIMNLTIAAIKYLRAVVAHGERGEHKPRNGDRIKDKIL